MYALPGKINNVFLYATRIVSQRRGTIAVNTCLDQAYAKVAPSRCADHDCPH